MKSFSDPNSTIQQERIKNAQFIIKVELFRQFDGAVSAVDTSAKTITVPGDASSLFPAPSTMLVPLFDFETLYNISAVSYSSGTGNTTLTLTTAPDAAMVGLHIARRYIVSYGDKERLIELSPVRFTTEGDALNEFFADDVTLLFDNGDGFFSNRNDTGIFDNTDNFWLRILTGYKYATDRILFYGGLVDADSLQADFAAKTFELTAYGHLKELERYPGYLLSEQNGSFVKINGLNIQSFTAGSAVREGVKTVRYQAFVSSKLSGVTIKQVSNDVTTGLKTLEFHYPNYFRYDRGAWVTIASTSDVDSNGDQKLYGKGGSGSTNYILCNFGSSSGLNEFPTNDTLIFLDIDGLIAKQVKKRGEMRITFDDGEERAIIPWFQRALVYDAAGGTYTDAADKLASPGEDPLTILSASADRLIIVAPERFWGLSVFFNTPYSADPGIEIRYSVGGETFSSAMNASGNGYSDGTAGFTKDGLITWDTADGWRDNVLTISTTVEYHGFMIEIRRTGGSGGCILDEVRRTLRLRGKDGDILRLTMLPDALQKTDVNDDIIIRTDGAGGYVAATWYQNVAISYILTLMLSQAQYSAANQDIDALKITSSAPKLSVFGQAPRYNYNKKPTAVLWDDPYLYIGVQNEIWRVKEDGAFEYITTFFPTAGSIINHQEIIRIQISGSSTPGNLITCWIRGRYADYNYSKTETSLALCTYDMDTGITTIQNDTVTTGEFYFRAGRKYQNSVSTGFYQRQIGQMAGLSSGYEDCGENLTVPIAQIVTVRSRHNTDSYLVTMPGLLAQKYENHIWYFPGTAYTGEKAGDYYDSIRAVYGVDGPLGIVGGSPDENIPPLGMRFTFGQQGVMLYDPSTGSMHFFSNQDDTLSLWNLVAVGGSGNLTSCTVFRENHLPACADLSSGYLYLGMTHWDDRSNNISNSYLSIYKQYGKAADWTKAFYYDTANYVDVTSTLNAGTAVLQMNNNRAMYVASDHKFASIYITLSSKTLSAVIAMEYWDGSAWVALTMQDSTSNLQFDAHITFEPPDDWAPSVFDTMMGVSKDSTARFWVRLRLSTYTSGSVNINYFYNAWSFMWDAARDNSGTYDTCSPIWMCHNSAENALHGCMFDRDENSPTGFEYLYFVYDIANGQLYISQTGSNFTFNPALQIKDFVYNSFDQKIYAVCEDIRYREEPAYLISAQFSAGAITLTKETEIVSGEWGSSAPLVLRAADGTIYGLTKGDKYYLWQYGKVFYPRLLLADFTDKTFREIGAEAAKVLSQVFTIRSNRKALIYERTSYDGEKSLYAYAHIAALKPVQRYMHIYDGIFVEWHDPYSGLSGVESYGTFGWRRKVLHISGDFIQSRFLALAVAEKYGAYFLTRREMVELDSTALIQTEERDRIKLIVNSANYDIDRSTYWILSDIELDPETLVMKLKGVN